MTFQVWVNVVVTSFVLVLVLVTVTVAGAGGGVVDFGAGFRSGTAMVSFDLGGLGSLCLLSSGNNPPGGMRSERAVSARALRAFSCGFIELGRERESMKVRMLNLILMTTCDWECLTK